MLGEHSDGSVTKIESRDVDFLEGGFIEKEKWNKTWVL